MHTMPPSICDVVSPYLLEALAASDDADTRLLATKTLDHSSQLRDRRRRFLEEADTIRFSYRQNKESTPQGIVPDQLLKQVVDSSEADSSAKELAQKTLDIKQQTQDGLDPRLATPSGQPSQPLHRREVYDMQNLEHKAGKKDETYRLLPGKLVRSEGQAPVDDEHANQAYENCVKVLDFYQQVLDYRFLNGRAIISSVHFEKGYQNASWMGEKIQQMVYGDGGGDLYNFTACLDIIGHEMTHAVIEHTCALRYEGESGALNEHLADVFGMLVTLWSENKTAAQSDWLIGEGCLMPGVKGVALRNMKFPGTAYDDPKVKLCFDLIEPANKKCQLGKDPQPASWSEIEAYKTKYTSWSTYDHGSVHAFSGVPNRAFVLVAEAFGGFAWEKAGKIWWSAMNSDRITPTCAFVQFADATVRVAEEMFGEDARKTVRECWNQVGVVEGTS